MTLEQIQDEIRSLKSSERIELYRWLDYEVAPDICSRIGADRSLEIRHAIEQNMKDITRSALTKGSHPVSHLKLDPE
jgi:hypothetical protein